VVPVPFTPFLYRLKKSRRCSQLVTASGVQTLSGRARGWRVGFPARQPGRESAIFVIGIHEISAENPDKFSLAFLKKVFKFNLLNSIACNRSSG